ncbi:MAG: DUF6782 family putative metallopeptidase [Gemmatimonadota bacterium]
MAAQLLPILSRKAGLPLKGPVMVERRSRAALEGFLLERLDEELPPQRADHIARAYHLLGLVAGDLDLRALLVQVYMEQVAGYYDPATSTLYLLEDQPPEATQGILVHELVHAVQDQAQDLDALTHRDRGTDARSAAQSAIEGHATLVMLEAMAEQLQGEEVDLSEIPDFSGALAPALENLTATAPALARAPAVIQESLLFPYVEGASFVHAIWVAEGRAPPFNRLLPAATVDVLHPLDFLERKGWTPQRPVLTSSPDGYEILFTETLGAQDLRILLRDLGHRDPRGAVRGWVGDSVILLQSASTGEVGLVFLSLWRDEGARDAAVAAFQGGGGQFPLTHGVSSHDDVLGFPAALLQVGLEGLPAMVWEAGEAVLGGAPDGAGE